MNVARTAQFAAAVAGSYVAGVVGAFFVWNFIYGIGESVVTDEIHVELHNTVIQCGGVTGGLAALATILLLRRPASGILAVGHVSATFIGIVGGSSGWKEGLWHYFGAYLAFVVCVACLCGFRHVSVPNAAA